MGDKVKKPIALTYYDVSNVKHTEVKKPLDYSINVFQLYKNQLSGNDNQPISLNDLGQLINKYRNDPRGKDYNKCLLKGLYKDWYKGENCIKGAPYLFFDIDVKDKPAEFDSNGKLIKKGKRENIHLFDPEKNQTIFYELKKLAVICWRSNSGTGIAGVLYVPQLALYLNPDRDLHKKAGEVITNHLSEYLQKVTGIDKITFDQAQSKFRQVRFLAEQKRQRQLNPRPFKFSYEVEQKVKEIAPGVTAYKPHNNRPPKGKAENQFNAEADILELMTDNGFTVVDDTGGQKVRVSHPKTTSATSGEVNRSLNLFFNHSKSLSKYNVFTPAQIILYFKFNENKKRFKEYLRELGYTDEEISEAEIKDIGKRLNEALKETTSDQKAGEIIFSNCYDLQTLTPEQKKTFINDYCPRPEFERFFKAYLNLIDNRIYYDKRFNIKKYVAEVLPEVLKYAEKHKKVILKAETGKGKTTAFIRDFHKYRPNARLLILEPLTIIIRQNENEYSNKAVFLDGNSRPAEFLKAEFENLVFATYQQGAKLLNKTDFDYIVIDEVHQLFTANSYKRDVISELVGGLGNNDAVLIGLTGTPNELFKNIGFKLIEVDVKHPQPTKIKLRFCNSRPYDIAVTHIRQSAGKTLLRLNDIKGLEILKANLISAGKFTEDEVLILYSVEQIKTSKDYLNLAHKRQFADKIKLVLTTSLIDEGLSIDQNGFTDVVFIEDSYTPRPEAVKQFFARFRNEDPDRSNYLYLRQKEDQTPGQFNPDWTYNDTLRGLQDEADQTPADNIKTTHNAVFGNDPYFFIDGSINPYYLGYSVSDVLFKTFNSKQFLEYLKTNYNLEFEQDPEFSPPTEDSAEKEIRTKLKQIIAGYWFNDKDEVKQAIASHTLDKGIKNKIKIEQRAINQNLELFVISQIKDFEKLFKRYEKLKSLGADDPDKVLIKEDDKGGFTLASTQKYKDEIINLKLYKLVFEPQTQSDLKALKRIKDFGEWCKDKNEITPGQLYKKLKSLGVYKNSDLTFTTIQTVLEWLGYTAKKCTKMKIISIT